LINPKPEEDDLCCGERKLNANGHDAVQGHQQPVLLELNEEKGVWNLVSPEWFSTPINNCPWCGFELPVPEAFELGKEEPSSAVEKLEKAIKASGVLSDTEAVSVAAYEAHLDDLVDAWEKAETEMDALLDSIEAVVKGGE